jgi:hypothetical protein
VPGRPGPPRRGPIDGGQVTPVLALVVLVVVVGLVLLGRTAAVAHDRARARSAADAGALAGAAEGRHAAAATVAVNGGRLERFDERGTTVEVTVRVGEAEASARAERRTSVRPGGP